MEGTARRNARSIAVLDHRQQALTRKDFERQFGPENDRRMLVFLNLPFIHLQDLSGVVRDMVPSEVQAELGDRGAQKDSADGRKNKPSDSTSHD